MHVFAVKMKEKIKGKTRYFLRSLDDVHTHDKERVKVKFTENVVFANGIALQRDVLVKKKKIVKRMNRRLNWTIFTYGTRSPSR